MVNSNNIALVDWKGQLILNGHNFETDTWKMLNLYYYVEEPPEDAEVVLLCKRKVFTSK